MSILNIKNEKYHTDANAFLDGDLSFQRYDTVKYKQFDKLTEKQYTVAVTHILYVISIPTQLKYLMN